MYHFQLTYYCPGHEYKWSGEERILYGISLALTRPPAEMTQLLLNCVATCSSLSGTLYESVYLHPYFCKTSAVFWVTITQPVGIKWQSSLNKMLDSLLWIKCWTLSLNSAYLYSDFPGFSGLGKGLVMGRLPVRGVMLFKVEYKCVYHGWPKRGSRKLPVESIITIRTSECKHFY